MVTVVAWVRDPLAPVIVTVKVVVSSKLVHVRVEVCEAPSVTLVGERMQERSGPSGVANDERTTVPVNPFKGETVTVDVSVLPSKFVMLVGLAVMVKSGALPTAKSTVAE